MHEVAQKRHGQIYSGAECLLQLRPMTDDLVPVPFRLLFLEAFV